MSLQDELKEAEISQEARVKWVAIGDRNIAALKQQVADAEVTYSVGDRLGFEDGVGERLIVSVGKYISIVDIEDGRSVGYIDDCVDKKKITKAELARINVCLEYIKIYDARKQSANN